MSKHVNTALAASRKRTWRSYLASYAMVAPAMCFLLVFVIYPMFHIIQLSMYKGNATNPYKKFVGLDNFQDIFFVKKDFLEALKNTAVYTVFIVVILIFLSLLFAVWMFQDRKINKIAQTAFFTPHLVASVSCAFIWSWLFNSDPYGLFNTVLKVFGAAPVNWLGDTRTAMACIIVMNTWKGIGYYALIILAALKSIPPEIYEAARLDNASRSKTFWKITLPMLSPQLFFLLITITIGSFKVFDSVRLMTGGGPGTSTQVISLYIYNYAFQRNNSLGVGSAAGVVLMVILILVTMLDFRGLEKRVHYQ
jgi:sn-glycerol 3-phosphate transport system permease protein